MTFSERVKTARIQERYSQSELSRMVGVKPNTVWRWENDKAKPDSETIVKIARALNTSVAYLLGETNIPEAPSEHMYTNESDVIKKAKRIAQQSEQDNFRNAVLGWTNDFFILKKGDTEVRVPITDKTQHILDSFMRRMLDSIADTVDIKNEEAEHRKSHLLDIHQKYIGRDATVNLGAVQDNAKENKNEKK